MKKCSLFLLLLVMGQWYLIQAQPNNEASWEPLLGSNFEKARYPEGSWKIENGVLTGYEDKVLWATGEYEHFILDLEFKNEKATNSGVIVYCTDKENWIPNSVEIQIADDYSKKWGTARKDYQCGAIFGHLPANEQKVVKKPGKWNTMRIKCDGQHITVKLNGKKVTFMDMSKWTSGEVNPDGSKIPPWLPTPFAELPTKGRIGFQGKHGDAKIHFRHIRIKPVH